MSNDPRRAPGRLLTAADAAAAEAFRRPDAAQLIGAAIAGVIRQEMPPVLTAALAQAIWQVHPPRMCAHCLAAFCQWEQDNADLVKLAVAAASEGARPGQPLDFRPHLPEELRPLVPNVERAITSVGGTECCKDHASEALSQQKAAA